MGLQQTFFVTSPRFALQIRHKLILLQMFSKLRHKPDPAVKIETSSVESNLFKKDVFQRYVLAETETLGVVS